MLKKIQYIWMHMSILSTVLSHHWGDCKAYIADIVIKGLHGKHFKNRIPTAFKRSTFFAHGVPFLCVLRSFDETERNEEPENNFLSGSSAAMWQVFTN